MLRKREREQQRLSKRYTLTDNLFYTTSSTTSSTRPRPKRSGVRGASNTPTLDLLFRICYAIQFWLDLDPRNVAVLHCTTGRLRTGLVVACYLVYSGEEDNGFDALRFFFSRRLRDAEFQLEDMTTKLLPSYKEALRHFHDVIALQGLPNPHPLFLSAIIINAIPPVTDELAEARDRARAMGPNAGAMGAELLVAPPVVEVFKGNVSWKMGVGTELLWQRHVLFSPPLLTRHGRTNIETNTHTRTHTHTRARSHARKHTALPLLLPPVARQRDRVATSPRFPRAQHKLRCRGRHHRRVLRARGPPGWRQGQRRWNRQL